MSDLVGVADTTVKSLSSTPELLLLAIVLVGVGFIAYKLIVRLSDQRAQQQKEMVARMEAFNESIKELSVQMAKIEQIMENYITKTDSHEEQLETMSKRLHKLANNLLVFMTKHEDRHTTFMDDIR